MSAEAVSTVYRHSPYTGTTFTVHLAIADSVNDQHGHRLWMSCASVAAKARVERRTAMKALTALTEDGWLRCIDCESPRPGKPHEYEFLFPEAAPVVYETRRNEGATREPTHRKVSRATTPLGVTADDTGCHEPRQGVSRAVTQTQENPSDPENQLRDPDGSRVGEVVDLDRGFPQFWAVYPARNGRKVAKASTLNKWRRMTIDDRRGAYHAAVAYASAVGRGETIAKDPGRFLASDYWRDWLVAPTAAPLPTPPARPSPLDGAVAASTKAMTENTARVKADDATTERVPMPDHLKRAGRA